MYAPIFLIKNWRYVLIASVFLFMAPLILIGGIFGISQNTPSQTDISGISVGKISPEVLRYEPTVTAFAKQDGIESYVPILLAYMMQESGGMVPDVMQSSESLGLPPNSITDPVFSIQVGVKYFANLIRQTNGDVKLALQSYNFGGAFIPYAESRGGYSKQVAIEFSQMMAAQMGWNKYGDVDYVDHVMRYVVSATPTTQPASNGNEEPYFQSLMQVALQYKGMPYFWGGNNPATSFDCSGLWEFSFKQIGIYVPRTAQDQYNYTERITKDQLKAGDFVFFKGTYNGPYITHVAIYVGNNNIYEAGNNGIGYATLTEYYIQHLAGYGRLKSMGNQ